MSSRLKIGVVGCGKMGSLHLAKFSELVDAEVVGFFERDNERAALVAKQFEIPSFDSVDQLLFEVDAVVVATTTTAHFEVCRSALRAGVHVLVEKPMSNNPRDIRQLYELARTHSLVFQVSLPEYYRFDALTKGFDLGGVKWIDCTRFANRAGNDVSLDVVSDLMVHDIDLALQLMASKVHSVTAQGTKWVTGAWDFVEAAIEFESGAKAVLRASRVASAPSRQMTFECNGGNCDIDFLKSEAVWNSAGQFVSLSTHQSEKPFDALSSQSKEFLANVKSLRPPRMSAGLAIEILDIVEKIGQSLRDNADYQISPNTIHGHEKR